MKAYVINLPERTDRWETFQQSWKDTGLELVRVDGIRMNDPYHAVFLKHRELLEQAKVRGDEHLLILEDDAVPCENFVKRFKHLRDYLDIRDDWDVLNGGMLSMRDVITKIVKIEDEGLATLCLRVHRGCMAHFLYCKVAPMLATIQEWEADGKPEFDGWYAHKLRCNACLPFLAIQHDGQSDATNSKREWEQRFNHEQCSMLFSLREFL
jgi:GR25 family glycosyltransferase involved in LPS biosynthesis